jgi:ethylmalonyl-CoA/methylmalonyl-CoA decarboxylase
MMEQLDGHLTTLERWSKFGVVDQDEPDTGAENNSRAIILTGSEGNFCSGLDLHEHAHSNNHHLQSGSQMNLHMTQFTNRLHSLPVPSIAAIDGHAIGGGAELSTCTDFVILSRCARVQFVHVMRGASPGWGGGRRLVNRVGRAKALKMLLLGECILGEEDPQVFSFADGVGQEGESAFDAALRLVAEPILKLPCSKAIRAVKSMVSAADGDGDVVDRQRTRIMYDTNLALAAERQAFLSVWGGDSNLKQINKTKESLKKKKNPSLR